MLKIIQETMQWFCFVHSELVSGSVIHLFMSTVCSKVCSITVKSKTEDAPSWLKSLAFVVLTVVCFPADLSNEAYWVGVSWQSCLCVAVWFRLLEQLTFLSQIWFLFIQKQLKTNIWPTFYLPKKIESWWQYIRHNVSWTVYLKGSVCIMWCVSWPGFKV